MFTSGKLNILANHHDQNGKVRSKVFTIIGARDTSWYEKMVGREIRTLFGSVETFFTFETELVALVRPLIIKCDTPRPLLLITGT